VLTHSFGRTHHVSFSQKRWLDEGVVEGVAIASDLAVGFLDVTEICCDSNRDAKVVGAVMLPEDAE